jgi:hypothetical protein
MPLANFFRSEKVQRMFLGEGLAIDKNRIACGRGYVNGVDSFAMRLQMQTQIEKLEGKYIVLCFRGGEHCWRVDRLTRV